MGTNNRQRRADKRRRAKAANRLSASRSASSGAQRGAGARPTTPVDTLIEQCLFVPGAPRHAAADREQALAALLEVERNADAEGESFAAGRLVWAKIVAHLGMVYANGWQPSDLVRHVGRYLDQSRIALVGSAMRHDAKRYLDRTDLHPSWREQILALGDDRPAVSNEPYPAWARVHAADPAGALHGALELLGLMRRTRRLPLLIPPPGCGPEVVDERLRHMQAAPLPDGLDRKLLERVRALLAKAESTTFAGEADSFTAKAQELMSRHSIDHALLGGGTNGGNGEGRLRPSARRMPVDDPYASPKALLLDKIARANRSTAVWDRDLAFSTVFGFDVDLDMVDLLYTSLLVQATAAMVAAGSQVDASGRSRTRSFRQSFLTSFAIRIGERLALAATDATEAAGRELGVALVPVLQERAEAVEQATSALFPVVSKRATSASHRGGWQAGRAAADRADLGDSPARPVLSQRRSPAS